MGNFDDETLMAYADGEVDEATAVAIEAAMDADAAVAERVALFFHSRQGLSATMKPLIDEPVPETLLAKVQDAVAAASVREAQTAVSGRVVPFPSGAARSVPAWRSHWAMPVAASILAVVTGVGGFVAGRVSVPDSGSGSAEEIARILSKEVSGRDIALPAAGGTLRLVSSFKDAAGELCREYELRTQAGSSATIACHADGRWGTRLTLASPLLDGYSPASAEETVDTYLGTISAGPALSVEEEAAALAGLK